MKLRYERDRKLKCDLRYTVIIAGRPGTDYPVLGKVPYTNFYCDDQSFPGFFADVETRCQAWHYCDIDGRQATFLCPNGTQFSQAVFVCDWWFNVRCELSPKLYAINSRLYGTPTESPTRPHRLITKELLENIFVRRKWTVKERSGRARRDDTFPSEMLRRKKERHLKKPSWFSEAWTKKIQKEKRNESSPQVYYIQSTNCKILVFLPYMKPINGRLTILLANEKQ